MLEYYAFLFFLCYNYLGFFSGYLASLIVWVLLGFVVTKVNYVFLKTPPDVKAFRRYTLHGFLIPLKSREPHPPYGLSVPGHHTTIIVAILLLAVY